MRWDITLRAIGIGGIVLSLILYSFLDVGINALVVTIGGILTVLFPDMIDKLPWGPVKPK